MQGLIKRPNPKKLMTTFLKSWPELFQSSDDAVWKEWVNFSERNTSSLVELVTADYRDGLKARALVVLMMPMTDWNPLYWNVKAAKSSTYLSYSLPMSDRLSPKLLSFYGQLVVQLCDLLEPYLAPLDDRQEVESSMGGELYEYLNSHLLDLLGMVIPSEQQAIFERYKLNDPSMGWSMDTASGYNPFERLLSNPEVDEVWKKVADSAMRKIITEECRGQSQPRIGFENALRCYIYRITSATWSDLPYSLELYASQINFLLSHGVSIDSLLVASLRAEQTYQRLSDPRYHELRHHYARFVILPKRSGYNAFSCRTTQSTQMVRAILVDYPGDAELCTKLRQLLTEAADRQAQEAIYKLEVSQATEALEARMR